jgi:oxygen-independent coproporphyrinogen III oxidase
MKDDAAALHWEPPHISAYCLTVPDNHSMSKNRPLNEEQAEMFETMQAVLQDVGYTRYEVSSYAKPGFESRHNTLYWTDEEYWGIGLSGHSFLKGEAPWGVRFWNPSGLKAYENLIRSSQKWNSPFENLPAANVEELALNQAITDYCHTHLRALTRGINKNALETKFPPAAAKEILARLNGLEGKGLIQWTESTAKLSLKGRLLADRVFEELTVLTSDLYVDKTMGLQKLP